MTWWADAGVIFTWNTDAGTRACQIWKWSGGQHCQPVLCMSSDQVFHSALPCSGAHTQASAAIVPSCGCLCRSEPSHLLHCAERCSSY